MCAEVLGWAVLGSGGIGESGWAVRLLNAMQGVRLRRALIAVMLPLWLRRVRPKSKWMRLWMVCAAEH